VEKVKGSEYFPNAVYGVCVLVKGIVVVTKSLKQGSHPELRTPHFIGNGQTKTNYT
jgi:hypothetical protein